VIADIALRPVLESRLSYSALNVSSHAYPPLRFLARWDSNLNLVDHLYGDLAALIGEPAYQERRQIHFQTDEAGFRNETVPKSIDVLILGDSFSAGWGTSQEQIFPQLLHRDGARTYNLAYPGGPYHQYLNFAIEWPRLDVVPHANLIWTLFVGNDLDDEGGEIWNVEDLPWQSPFQQWLVRWRTYRNRSPLNRMTNNVLARWSHHGASGVIVRRLPDSTAMLFYEPQETWNRKSLSEVKAHPNFMKLQRTLAVMRDLTYKRALKVTVLIFPTKGDIYRWILDERQPARQDRTPSAVSEALRQACEEAGFSCIDLKPYLYDRGQDLYRSAGKLLWWRDDTHLGEEGHQAVASFIAKHILHSDKQE